MIHNTMDPIWKTIPSELSNHICNQLPKVCKINDDLKKEIESQRWMLAKIINWYIVLADYNSRFAFSMFRRDLGIKPDVDINIHWNGMSQDQRINFFYAPYGPGTREGRNIIEIHENFREWIEETRDF